MDYEYKSHCTFYCKMLYLLQFFVVLWYNNVYSFFFFSPMHRAYVRALVS